MPISPYDTNQNANAAVMGGASANNGMGFSKPGLPMPTGGGGLSNAAAQAMQQTQQRQSAMEADLNRPAPMLQQDPMVAINSQTGEVDTGAGTFNVDNYHQGMTALQQNWLSTPPKYLRPGFTPIPASALANYIQNPTSSTWDRIKDTGIDIARGVVNSGQTAAGLASLATGGLAGKGLAEVGYDPQRTHEMLSEGYSRGRQAAEDQVNSAQGFFGTAGAMIQNPSTVLGGAIQSAPDMIGAYGVARKAALGVFNRAYAAALEASGGNAEYAGTMAANALKANQGRLLAIGHGTEGIQAAGQNAGQVMNDDPNNVVGQYMQIPGGALTGLIGYGAGRVANAVGLEDPLAGLAKRGLSGPVGGKAASLSRTAGRIVGGGVVEGGLEEGPQSAQEQVWQNLGQNKPWDEGVGKAAGQGAVIGAAMGMGMSALHGRAHVDARDNMNPQELLKSGTQMQLAGMNPTQPAAPLHVGADQNQMYEPPTPPGGIPNSGQMDMFPQGDLFGPAGPASTQPQQGAMAFRDVPNPGQMQLPLQGTMFGQTPTPPMAAPPVPILEQTHPGQGNLFDQHGYPYTRPQDDWLHSDGSQQTQTRPARPYVPIEQMHPGVFQINEPPTEPPAPPAGGGRSNAAQHHVPGPATQAETKNRAHGGAIVNPPGEPIARGMGPQESDAITGHMTNPPGELNEGYPEGIRTGRQKSLWDAARSAGVEGEDMLNAIGSGKYAYAEKLIPKLVKEKAHAAEQDRQQSVGESEHPNGSSGGQAAEAGRGDRTKRAAPGEKSASANEPEVKVVPPNAPPKKHTPKTESLVKKSKANDAGVLAKPNPEAQAERVAMKQKVEDINKDITNNPDKEHLQKDTAGKLADIASDSRVEIARLEKEIADEPNAKKQSALRREMNVHKNTIKEAEALAEELNSKHEGALEDAMYFVNNPDDRGTSSAHAHNAGDESTAHPLQKLIKDGRSAARYLADHMKNTALRAVAAKIMPYLDNVSIHTYDGTGTAPPLSVTRLFAKQSVGGVTHLNVRTGAVEVWIHTKRGGMTEEVMLHELVHGATTELLIDPENAAKFTELMKSVRDSLKAIASESPMARHLIEQFNDVDEFVAYGFTSPTFQKFMAAMDGSGKWNGKIKVAEPVTVPKYSMWQRFIDAIRTMLGLPKVYERQVRAIMEINRAGAMYAAASRGVSLEQRMNELMDELLSKSPNKMVARGSEKVSAYTAAEAYSKTAEQAIKQAKTAGEYLSEAKLWLTSLSQLDDIYGNELKDDKDKSYIKTIVEGLRNIGSTKEQIRRNADSIRQQFDLLTGQEQAHLGSMLPLVSGYGFKSTGKDSKLELTVGDSGFKGAFEKVKAEFDKMTLGEKVVYTAMRDEISHLNKMLIKEVTKQAERRGGDKLTVLQRILTSSERQTGDYFPWMRFGDHVVVFKSPEFKEAEKNNNEKAMNKMKSDAKHYDVRFFEDKGSAQVDLTAMQAEKGMDNVVYFKSPDYIRTMDNVSAKFMEKLDGMFDSKKPHDMELKKAITALYIRSMPDYANANRSLTRTRVAGYSKDSRRAFAAYADRMAGSIGKTRHIDEVVDALNGANAKAKELSEASSSKTGVADPKFQQVVDILQAHQDALLNPKYKSGAWQTFATNTAYVWHLATASFGLTNLAQGSLISAPVMAARLKISNVRAQAAITSALSDAFRLQKGWFNEANGKLWDRIAEFGPKFMNVVDNKVEYVEPDLSAELKAKLLTAGEAELIKHLYRKSQIDLTQAHDLSAVAEGRNTRNQKIMRTLSMFAHQTEVMNRISTGLAAYRLSMKHNGMHDSEAVRQAAAEKFAEKIIQDTHGDYSTENAPLAFKPGANPLARVMMQFRKYQQMMVYLYGRNIKQSLPIWNDADPETKALARRTLVNLLMTQGLAAGVMGMPFFGSIAGLAGLIAAALNGKDDPWDEDRVKAEFRGWLSDTFGKEAGETMAHGMLYAPLIRNILPASASQRIGQEDIGQLVNQKLNPGDSTRDSFFQYLGKAVAGPAGGVVADMATAYDMFHQGRFDRGFEYATPKFMRDILKTVRYSNEGLTDSKGVTILNSEHFTPIDKFWQAVGFTPTDVAETQEARGAQASYVADIGERKQNLINQFVRARMSGDTTEAAHIRDVLGAKFNETNPQERILGKDWNSAYISANRNQMNTTPSGMSSSPRHSDRAEMSRFANVQ